MQDKIIELILEYREKVKSINDAIEENTPNLHTAIRLNERRLNYMKFIDDLTKLL